MSAHFSVHTQRSARYEDLPRIAVVLDCTDLERVAEFWTRALGYRAAEPHEPYLSLEPYTGDGPVLLLQRVPEPKIVKNRLHLDLRVEDLDAEVERVTRLGARRLTTVPFRENGWRWHVLADPEDNEFCILRPPPQG